MASIKLLSLATIGLIAQSLSAAPADTAEGTVRVAGGGFSQQVQVIPEKSETPTVLCDSSEVARVKKLAAMTVKVTGQWQTNKQGQKTCLDVKEFKVTKHISGREPLVGTLVKSDSYFVIKSDSGVEHKLAEVSSGLAKLTGKKVIVDAKSISTATKKGLKVVSYGEFP